MITPTSITRISANTYRYTFTGDFEPPFRVYRGGVLILETSATTFDIDSESSTMPPYVEILDATETDEPLQTQFPATIRIQWRGVNGVSKYVVTDGDGVVKAGIAENGQGYYSYQAVALTPGAAATYTVTAYDQAGASLGNIAATSYIVAHAAPEEYDHTVTAGVLIAGRPPIANIPKYEAYIRGLISAYGGACWPLDDAVGATSIRELSGLYPGTKSATGVTLQSAGPTLAGTACKAAAFDGAAGKISATVAAAVSGLTLSCWAKYSTANPITNCSMIAGGATWDAGYSLVLLSSGSTIMAAKTSANAYTSITTPTPGSWYHFCGVYNGSNVSVYLNGVQTGTPTTQTGNVTSVTSLLIGAERPASLRWWWPGSLAYPLIVPAALTPLQIAALYAAEA